MSSAYEERYGGNLRKDELRSIVWKDSQRLTNFLRDNKLLDQALESNEKSAFSCRFEIRWTAQSPTTTRARVSIC